MADELPLLNPLLQSDLESDGFSINDLGGLTMTAGFATLFQDPTDPMHAATKDYVDSSGGGTALPDDTHAVYVSKIGNDADSGLNLGEPKLTIGSAVTAAAALIVGGATGVSIMVTDGGTYTENVSLPDLVVLEAHAAVLEGTLTLDSRSSAYLDRHFAGGNGETSVTKTGGAGHGFYQSNILDTRGIAGAFTAGRGLSNDSSGSILFAMVGVLFVAASGIGVRDNGAGNGHIHFWTPDLYLAGNNAIGIQASTANSNFIGYIDHILEFGTPTGTQGIVSSNAAATTRITATEIVADTAYNITNGNVYLQSVRVVGTKTGTPVYESSDGLHKLGAAAGTARVLVNPSVLTPSLAVWATWTPTATSGNHWASNFALNATPSAATSGQYRGVECLAGNASGNNQNFTGQMAGGFFQGSLTGSGTGADLRGVIGRANHTGTATVASAIGMEGSVYRITGTATLTEATCVLADSLRTHGTLTTAYGFRATHAGNCTDYYGLFLTTPTGTITNNWGIYQQGPAATNFLAGPLVIGSGAPSLGSMIVTRRSTTTATGWSSAFVNYGARTSNGTLSCVGSFSGASTLGLTANITGEDSTNVGICGHYINPGHATATYSISLLQGLRILAAHETGAGALTTMIGLDIELRLGAASLTTTAYGILIRTRNGTSVTNYWPIYQAEAAGANFFAARMGLGISTFPTMTGFGIAIGNITTAPSSNPVTGGVLYSEAGALKWRGSSGSITTIAPA